MPGGTARDLNGELCYRDIRVGIGEQQRVPGTVVQPLSLIDRSTLDQLGHPLRESGRSRCGIAQAVQFVGKAVEVVNGFGLARPGYGGLVRLPMGRYAEDRLWPRQFIA